MPRTTPNPHLLPAPLLCHPCPPPAAPPRSKVSVQHKVELLTIPIPLQDEDCGCTESFLPSSVPLPFPLPLYPDPNPQIPVQHWVFPDRTTPIGITINAYLKNTTAMDAAAIHLLFVANRFEKRCAQASGHLTCCARPIARGLDPGLLHQPMWHSCLPPLARHPSFSRQPPHPSLPPLLPTPLPCPRSELLSLLSRGTTLVVDRYSYSGVAYTAAKGVPHLGADYCRAVEVRGRRGGATRAWAVAGGGGQGGRGWGQGCAAHCRHLEGRGGRDTASGAGQGGGGKGAVIGCVHASVQPMLPHPAPVACSPPTCRFTHTGRTRVYS